MNLLLVGVGGGSHEGAYLADAIILARVSKGEARLLSIPRDLVVAWPMNAQPRPTRKINAVFAVEAASRTPVAGLRALEDVVARWLGVEIDASLAVDFTGFVKVIDSLGGVGRCFGQAG